MWCPGGMGNPGDSDDTSISPMWILLKNVTLGLEILMNNIEMTLGETHFWQASTAQGGDFVLHKNK